QHSKINCGILPNPEMLPLNNHEPIRVPSASCYGNFSDRPVIGAPCLASRALQCTRNIELWIKRKRAAMVITSLLDTDLYKFTMMQVVLHHFPAARVEYRYKCRTPNVDLRPYLEEIREEIHHLCSLRFKEEELAYLRSLRFIKSDF